MPPESGKHGAARNAAAAGRRPHRWLFASGLALALVWPRVAYAQEAATFFQQNCMSCHTIGGGRLVGPDLKNVTQRKDREWLATFVLNPQGMLSRGDPYAQKLLDEARGVVMPTVVGITRDRVATLLDLIEAESKLEKSKFAGMQLSARPFTPQDVAVGRNVFLGVQPLLTRGPACVSCHTVRGIGGLGGGRLGQDLTKVYERLGGRQPLAAWLVGPATTTMRSVFATQPLQPEEILPLVAYFEQAAQQPGQDDGVAPLNFFLVGLGGAALGLIGFDGIWRRRFRGVRRALVGGVNVEAKS